jgi:hypothetical protein
MHAQIYLNILIGLILAIILFMTGKLNQLNKRLEKHLKENKGNAPDLPAESNWYIYPALALAIIAIIGAFCAPYLYTDISGLSDTKETGAMGDTIGGLMNPYIALAGVIITGLAFYMQYEANKQQRTLFLLEQNSNKEELQDQINRQDGERKLQQFEAQFYEMIRLHRENVSEMEINGYDFEQATVKNMPLEKFTVDTTGRKIFVTMKTELECVLSAYKAHTGKDLDASQYAICYEIFFSGLDKYIKTYGNTNPFALRLHLARRKHQFPTRFKIDNNQKRKYVVGTVNMNFNYKPFSGHASRLGHYFRHLYLIVKQVVFSEALEDDKLRRNYLRILRAQLSNHEQILLFYNWMGEHGDNWENDQHHFFTKYNVIHNLWYNELIDDPFIQSKVNQLREKAQAQGNMDIFEID